MDKQDQELALAALERMEGNIKTLRSLISGKTSSNSALTATSEQISAKVQTEPQLVSGLKRPEKDRSKFQVAQSLPVDQLGPAPEFRNNSEWPQAVPPQLIVSTDTNDPIKKQFRAVQMVGLMGVPTSGMRVLDCGCGEGYTSDEIAKTAAAVVGYDITASKTWENFSRPNLQYTTNRRDVDSDALFDFVILYDVIDHLEGEGPDEFLRWVASLLAPGGRVFLRCHPWTSRHGGHLYEKINKAYIHLALTTDEMTRLGFKLMPNLKISRPLATYDNLITKAGFTIENRKGHTEPVEKFFSGEILDRIIKVTWRGTIDHQTALKIMGNQFIDYTLIIT